MGLWETAISPLEKPRSQLELECQNLFLNLVELDLLQYWVIYVTSALTIYNLVKAQLQGPPLPHLYLDLLRFAGDAKLLQGAKCVLQFVGLTDSV